MSRCRKCGRDVYPGTRCRDCAEKWKDARMKAFNETIAAGLTVGTPEFTKSLHRLEKQIKKASTP